MSWPQTGSGSLATGYLASGVTTIRWGSKELITSIAGTAVNGTTVGIVTRFNQRALVENIKLPNGSGLTTTRVQIIDGYQWDATVRDDTNITNRPQIGDTVVIVDAAGLISGTVSTVYKYSATVTESGYDASPKQAGEFTVTVEALTLVEGLSGSSV